MASRLVYSCLQQQQTNARALITVYMAWYTFFWALNAAALAWVFGKETAPGHWTLVVAWFFAVMDVCGGISCFAVMVSVLRMMTGIGALVNHQLGKAKAISPEIADVCRRPPFPRTLILWGLSVNGATLLGMAVLWPMLAALTESDAAPTRPPLDPTLSPLPGAAAVSMVSKLSTSVANNTVEVTALGLALAAFCTAWANHLLGVYNKPAQDDKSIEDKPEVRQRIQRGHALCWQLACGGNFAILWATIAVLGLAAYQQSSPLPLFYIIVMTAYLLSSTYAWFGVAPRRLGRTDRPKWWHGALLFLAGAGALLPTCWYIARDLVTKSESEPVVPKRGAESPPSF